MKFTRKSTTCSKSNGHQVIELVCSPSLLMPIVMCPPHLLKTLSMLLLICSKPRNSVLKENLQISCLSPATRIFNQYFESGFECKIQNDQNQTSGEKKELLHQSSFHLYTIKILPNNPNILPALISKLFADESTWDKNISAKSI